MGLIANNATLVRVQNKGLITLPKVWRKELGIEEGGLVEVEKKSGELRIRPVRVINYPVRSYRQEEIEQFLKLDAQETKKLKAKGLL